MNKPFKDINAFEGLVFYSYNDYILLTKYILCCTMYVGGSPMNVDEWKSQIKRGTLEYCILLMINKKTYYGYEILQKLNKYPVITAKESTIYPLLRRLLNDGYLSSTWQETSEGLPPRKYYAITKKGEEYLQAMSHEWNNLLNTICDLKGE